jgi:hypothetical protein
MTPPGNDYQGWAFAMKGREIRHGHGTGMRRGTQVPCQGMALSGQAGADGSIGRSLVASGAPNQWRCQMAELPPPPELTGHRVGPPRRLGEGRDHRRSPLQVSGELGHDVRRWL